MTREISLTRESARKLKRRKAALCSLALLAAPAANQCDSASAGGGLPCDVDNAVRSKCQACHGSSTKFGAPMSLATYEDTQKAAVSDPSKMVWQMMQARIHSTTNPMPPRGQTPLTDAELAALDRWFGTNAAAGSAQCTNLVAPGDLGALSGPAYLPCTPNRTFNAHASGSTNEFSVPATYSNSYICFNFDRPFATNEQAIAWAPLIDNDQVIHHMILYGVASRPAADTSSSCYGPTLSGSMVAGWAPGGTNAVMDTDVGLNLDFPAYQLQIHYANNTGASTTDSSGVGFCTTTTPRQNTAGIVTLGQSPFTIPAGANSYPVVGQCNNLSSDAATTMTVIATQPHMHLLGSGFRTEHLGHDDLSNIPQGGWNFDAQRHYSILPRRQVLPGEQLRTTCYYDNPGASPVSFGPKTQDEMCYDFITVYPYAAAVRKCGPTL
jgi:cytochrome c5